MKNIFILCSLILLSVMGAKAQSQGVHFEKCSLKEALAKAKKENKLVFLDTYTAWCSACKWMDKTTFQEKEVADFFNSNFVNIKFDTEKGEGIEIKQRYSGINAYPTYFILDTEGNELHRISGGGLPQEFMEKVKVGMNPETCQKTLSLQYTAGNRERAFIVTYLEGLETAGLEGTARSVVAQYILELNEQVTDSSNWFLFQNYIHDNPFSPEFKLLLDRKSEFIRHNGEQVVNAKINAVFSSSTFELFNQNTYDNPNIWTELETMVNQHQPADYSLIMTMLRLAKSKAEGDLKKLMEITINELIPAPLDSRQKFFFFKIIQSIISENGTESEKAEFKKALNAMISALPEQQEKEHFQRLLKE